MEDVTVKLENDVREIAALEVCLGISNSFHRFMLSVQPKGKEPDVTPDSEVVVHRNINEARGYHRHGPESENDSHENFVDHWRQRNDGSVRAFQLGSNI